MLNERAVETRTFKTSVTLGGATSVPPEMPDVSVTPPPNPAAQVANGSIDVLSTNRRRLTEEHHFCRLLSCVMDPFCLGNEFDCHTRRLELTKL